MFGEFMTECWHLVLWFLDLRVPGFNFNMLSFILFCWALALVGHLLGLITGAVDTDTSKERRR